jgi:chorismate mutase
MIDPILTFVMGWWIPGILLIWGAVTLFAVYKADGPLFQGAGFFAALFGLLTGLTLGGDATRVLDDTQTIAFSLDLREAEIERLRLSAEISEAKSLSILALAESSENFIALNNRMDELRDELNLNTVFEDAEIQNVEDELIDMKRDIRENNEILNNSISDLDRNLSTLQNERQSAMSLVDESKNLLSEITILELIMVVFGALQGSFGYFFINNLNRKTRTC